MPFSGTIRLQSTASGNHTRINHIRINRATSSHDACSHHAYSHNGDVGKTLAGHHLMTDPSLPAIDQ
jgi:hypothetical protein